MLKPRRKSERKPATPSASRGRPRQAESYTDWMARMDTEVDVMARKLCAVPAARQLTGPQRRILEMLAEHMRALPLLQPGESPYDIPAYLHVRCILTRLFRAKYPDWKVGKDGEWWIDSIPAGECAVYDDLFRNCAGRAPAPAAFSDDDYD